MKPTKQHILDKALLLFNEKGFVNVRLQHIADSAFVSVGHLAYHFKNKEDIVLSIYKKLKKSQELLLTEFRILPLFEDIDFLLRHMYQLQQQYRFFYLDTLEVLRAFSEIAEKHHELLRFQRQQIIFMMQFNASRGSFIQPIYGTQFADLAHIFCMTMDHWLSYQYINGSASAGENDYCNDLWSIVRVLFTDMGLPEFRQLGNKGMNYL
ncbi:MAG: TetR/AcrR family transcriptional regulator [Chitinophagaceae bacterium]